MAVGLILTLSQPIASGLSRDQLDLVIVNSLFTVEKVSLLLLGRVPCPHLCHQFLQYFILSFILRTLEGHKIQSSL